MQLSIKPLDGVKKGDTLWRLMERHNPQMGVYYVFEKATVTRLYPKSVGTKQGSFSKETGQQKWKEQGLYGSAHYTLMREEDATRIHEQLLASGRRVRGFKKENHD
jgi:hypothetical protein